MEERIDSKFITMEEQAELIWNSSIISVVSLDRME